MTFPLSELLDPVALDGARLTFLQREAYYHEILIDAAELRRRVRLDYPSTWSDPKTDTIDAGKIGSLPVEGITNILHHTTISDLFRLRATNSHIKYLIEQWEPFKLIITHGGDAVRALLATGGGLLWTAGQLVNVLFTTKCELCGEHGEILQLLKLKRCCFRCLSDERELLAIPIEYAEVYLGLLDRELESLPKLTTICQKDLWGYPSHEGVIVDYKTALKVSAGRALDCSRRHQTAGLYSYLSFTTGDFLEDEFRSIQPRPTTRIHERRGQSSPMTLPPAIIAAPETAYRQHACSIRQPAMTRKCSRLADGTFKYNVTVINAVRCEGCAYFWNYHCPLPHQFHKMYVHDSTGGPTEFTKHFQHCIYAYAHWTRINCPWLPVPLDEQIMILEKWKKWFWPRHSASTIEKVKPKFELISVRLQNLAHLYSENFNAFQQPYKWPTPPMERSETNEELLTRRRVTERERKLAMAHHPDDNIDQYWDMLVSQEAASQSNWACANLYNGSSALFRGPLTLLQRKRERLDWKLWFKGTANQKQPEWGFDWFYQ
jgi:hypothetical protein